MEKTFEDLQRHLRPPVPSVLAALRGGSSAVKVQSTGENLSVVEVPHQHHCGPAKFSAKGNEWLRLRHCSKQFIILRLESEIMRPPKAVHEENTDIQETTRLRPSSSCPSPCIDFLHQIEHY